MACQGTWLAPGCVFGGGTVEDSLKGQGLLDRTPGVHRARMWLNNRGMGDGDDVSGGGRMGYMQ